LVRGHAFKKWHRKPGVLTIEKEDVTSAFFDGKTQLPRETWNFVHRRNSFTPSVWAVFPTVQRTN
jgi:hypothetical protein